MAVRRDLRKSMPIHADPVIAKFCTLPAVKCLINAVTGEASPWIEFVRLPE